MTDVLIRPARKDEAEIGGKLLFMSGPELFSYAFNRSAEATQRVLARLWPRYGHIFSYQWANLAESDSQVVGILSGFTSQELRRASTRATMAFASALWPWELARMIGHLLNFSNLSPEVSAGDYYIGNVAVIPEARSRGIGHRLLAFAEDQAIKCGCSRCALDVVIENTHARALYESCGYAIAETRTNPRLAKRCGISGMHRMVKQL